MKLSQKILFAIKLIFKFVFFGLTLSNFRSNFFFFPCQFFQFVSHIVNFSCNQNSSCLRSLRGSENEINSSNEMISRNFREFHYRWADVAIARSTNVSRLDTQFANASMSSLVVLATCSALTCLLCNSVLKDSTLSFSLKV